MSRLVTLFVYLISSLLISVNGNAQQSKDLGGIETNFFNPPASAKPWVFWYWMHGAISRQGITADLEAMKEVGIGGAYLMTIKDTTSAVPFQPVARQLTPEWWEMVGFAISEAARLGLELGMHVSDGFALAGGPWITPELSMQKLVWSRTYVKTGHSGRIRLEIPGSYPGYYKDVAVYAYPANSAYAFSDETMLPTVTTSNGTEAQFLSVPGSGSKQSFRSDTACWIQYKYPRPFTCRSIRIHTGTNSYQAQRLIIQTSDDGINFKTVTRLEPPRHGWQDTEEDYTHAIKTTTAQYFRFVYNKEGSEPGAEDLDAAKWRPSLRVMGIYLSDEPVINQIEAKNGSVWRVASPTTSQQVADEIAVARNSILHLTTSMDPEGNLNWVPPKNTPGNNSPGWVIVRIGHTSTGQTNATGGAAKGLECDKFNATAVKLQFDNWFGKLYEKTDPALAKQVIKVFHVDSWECGSQNWSENFAMEFKKRRGYDLLPFLLVMTGVPVESASASERVLHDVRTTIAELVNDIFYATLKRSATAKDCSFSAESIAPTFVSDGLLHYRNVDLPMGEFWLNSPTHDKPNDMLDAISGAHIYGKNIVQAEAFTSVRMNWGEHPGNLKVIGDRNFALGINKMVLHVFTHNPWMDRKPGMTLDGVGLYFQRDQTWFRQSKAWIEYMTRCQALLQMGKPVVDIAVFTGEEVPRRSVLPDRLINCLPGIFGSKKIEEERKRLMNTGQPLRTIPDGVTHSANMADPEDWIDPLNGYAYDSFNPDALMMMSVKNGRVILPGGATYKLLVVPGRTKMNPGGVSMSLAVARKLLQLSKAGATIIMDKDYQQGLGLQDKDNQIRGVLKEIFQSRGKIEETPYTDSSFGRLGLPRDVDIKNNDHSIAWTHRKAGSEDIYFIANQLDKDQQVEMSLNTVAKMIEVWDPVKAVIISRKYANTRGQRTYVNLSLAAYQSVFIVLSPQSAPLIVPESDKTFKTTRNIQLSRWLLSFDTTAGGMANPLLYDTGQELLSWTSYAKPAMQYYSGTAVYTSVLSLEKNDTGKTARLKFENIYNIATVKINGANCGTLWTKPYVLDVTKAIKAGENKIIVEVTNTWHNRLVGDNTANASKKITWTTAPFRLRGKQLLPGGLTGKVFLEIE